LTFEVVRRRIQGRNDFVPTEDTRRRDVSDLLTNSTIHQTPTHYTQINQITNMNSWKKMILTLIGMMIMTDTAAYIISPQPQLSLNNLVPAWIAQAEKEQHQPAPSQTNLTPSSLQQQHPLRQQQRYRPAVAYSLGLGKNSAVGNYRSTPASAQQQNDSRNDIIEAVQHWNDHLAVNEIPNPALVARARAASVTVAAANKRRKASTVETLPRIVLQRFFHDQLPITTEEPSQDRQQPQHDGRDVVVVDLHHDDDKRSSSTSIPTMKSRTPVVRQFDLNTPWVEMLIHEQQVVNFA
jgi:hypothetical protein